MIAKTLYALASNLPLRIIDDGGRQYLERYFLFDGLGVTAYLHRFVGDDPARGLHDHPWLWAVSFILSNEYDEHHRGHGEPKRVRWFNWLIGDSFHRVTLPNGEVWTLFIHRSRKSKPWGFMREFMGTGSNATMTFTPHAYEREGGIAEIRKWWLRAPKACNHIGRVAFPAVVTK